MTRYTYFLITLFMLVIVTACQDFGELEQNPNRPSTAPASLVLNGVLNDLTERPWSLEHRQNQFWCCNYNYYGTNEYWASASLNFMTLKNIQKMEEEAKRSGAADVNPYSSIGKFLKAYFYVRMSQRVGDVPLAEALQGLDNEAPGYDTQKAVYLQVLNWLDEANTELGQLIAANNLTLAGDFYFNNDLTKWRKAVNTFKLRVLISLSKKEADTDLNVKARFKQVLDNPAQFPVMSSLSDNMQYVFNASVNLYPTNPGNRGFDKGRYNMAQTYVKGLTDLNDPRVFVTCNPAKAKLAGGIEPDDFAAYVGAPSGEALDDMTFKAGNGQYSYANQKRYYTTFAGPEPGVQLGYAELCFNIAEAINRGWATGNAETYYTNGIKASMDFYGIKDGVAISITEQDNDEVIGSYTPSVTNYLTQPAVAYAGNNVSGLNQILTQKYLAFFQISGHEAYFNFRRTGVPAFHTGPGTGNGGVIPKRWLYPLSETVNNPDNYSSAVQRQFGSAGDDLDNELWINQ
ncbi:MAG: SusD/RagB family nutrient-binding outer membrane lipoprotein [Cyclobacteriaceae bacterium]|nr:SusD/RagB family nutrient-binding outer membrane lipoprotein [Cyclobacteriaceae bacterium]